LVRVEEIDTVEIGQSLHYNRRGKQADRKFGAGTSAMARFRYQFTLRQLIKLVALAAACFGLLRTPAWPFLLAVALVLPGFAIDRARGDAGVLGSILASMIGFVGIGTTLFIYYEWPLRQWLSDGLPLLFLLLVYVGLLGLIWGFFVGVSAGLIVFLVRRRIRPEPSQGKSLADRSTGAILMSPHEATYR
jgi:hypothetical protein